MILIGKEICTIGSCTIKFITLGYYHTASFSYMVEMMINWVCQLNGCQVIKIPLHFHNFCFLWRNVKEKYKINEITEAARSVHKLENFW